MARQSARNATTLTSYQGSTISNMGRVQARAANSSIANAGPNMARTPAPSPARSMPMPAAPSGSLVPGRSAGSMVWKPNAAAQAPAVPARTSAAAAPVNRPAATSAPRPAAPANWGNNNPLTGRPMGTEGLGRPLGAPMPRSSSATRVDTSYLRGNNPLTGRPMGTESLGRPIGESVPFGGFFAEGGVAPAGAASIVGENGPEIIVPQAPTTVIPIQMPGQRRESEAPVSSRSGVDQLILGQEAARYQTEADARWNEYLKNTDPAKDAILLQQTKQADELARMNRHMFENPPMPVQAATIVNTGSAMDRHMATGLSGQPRRQVGRSANDPMRIAEQQRRRGNYKPILQMGQAAMEQQTRQALADQDFAQRAAMFQAQQQVQNQRADIDWQRQQQRDAANYQQQEQAWQKRDTANFQQQQQLEAERRAYENAQQLRKEQAGKIVRFENIPTPDGKGFIPVAVRADGSYDMAGGYMPSRDETQRWQKIEGTDMYVLRGAGSEELPPGQTWRKEGDRYVPNVAPAWPKIETVTLPDGTRVSMQRNPQTGQLEPLPIAPGTPAPAPAPAGGGQTPGGAKFSRVQ